MKISVVSPVYKAEAILPHLVDRNEAVLQGMGVDYEIVLVNDHSPDRSWEVIEKICSGNPHVVGVDLSRNFGQHPAISAGLSVVSGDWVVVMDCDLQDRPEEIPSLYRKALDGYDIVLARRAVRQDSPLKRLSSNVFHHVFDWFSGIKTDKAIANFGIYRRCVTDEVVKIPDQSRGLFNLIHHLGFRTATVDVEHNSRFEGKSSYTLAKLLKFAFENIISNSNKPLRMAVGLGFIMSFVSFCLALYNVVAKLMGLITVAGFTATVFSIWFVGGLILLVLGVLGIYIGKIYDQVKGRPYMVIRKTINLK